MKGFFWDCQPSPEGTIATEDKRQPQTMPAAYMLPGRQLALLHVVLKIRRTIPEGVEGRCRDRPRTSHPSVSSQVQQDHSEPCLQQPALYRAAIRNHCDTTSDCNGAHSQTPCACPNRRKCRVA